MNVTEIVERLRPFSRARIDTGFRQGREAVLRQLNRRRGQDQNALVDAYMADMQNTIEALIQRAAPYQIPDDYLFFLEYFGGLRMEAENSNFSVLGTGPMVEDWYPSIDSDQAVQEPGRYGLLSIGSLNFRAGHKYQSQHVDIFSDLGGIIDRHYIIGIGPWGLKTPRPATIIKDIHAYPGMWKKLANSFTEFLGQAAETGGAFIYG